MNLKCTTKAAFCIVFTSFRWCSMYPSLPWLSSALSSAKADKKCCAIQTQKTLLSGPRKTSCTWVSNPSNPLKSATGASLERLMTIDLRHKPPGQQTSVFPPAGVSSKLIITHSLSLEVTPLTSPDHVQGQRLLFAFFCVVQCGAVADVCLSVCFPFFAVFFMNFSKCDFSFFELQGEE